MILNEIVLFKKFLDFQFKDFVATQALNTTKSAWPEGFAQNIAAVGQDGLLFYLMAMKWVHERGRNREKTHYALYWPLNE